MVGHFVLRYFGLILVVYVKAPCRRLSLIPIPQSNFNAVYHFQRLSINCVISSIDLRYVLSCINTCEYLCI